jgi:hypothetical protein
MTRQDYILKYCSRFFIIASALCIFFWLLTLFCAFECFLGKFTFAISLGQISLCVENRDLGFAAKARLIVKVVDIEWLTWWPRLIKSPLGTAVFIPLWMPAVGFAFLGLLIRLMYRKTLKIHPTCKICGYYLRGLTEPRCPECGELFDPKLLEKPEQKRE